MWVPTLDIPGGELLAGVTIVVAPSWLDRGEKADML